MDCEGAPCWAHRLAPSHSFFFFPAVLSRAVQMVVRSPVRVSPAVSCPPPLPPTPLVRSYSTLTAAWLRRLPGQVQGAATLFCSSCQVPPVVPWQPWGQGRTNEQAMKVCRCRVRTSECVGVRRPPPFSLPPPAVAPPSSPSSQLSPAPARLPAYLFPTSAAQLKLSPDHPPPT